MSHDKIQGRCKLCGELKIFVKAHIIPEFLYREMYNEQNQISIVEKEQDNSSFKKLRKGIWDSEILCKECDQGILNKRYDDYAAKVFWGYRNLDFKIKDYHSEHDTQVTWRAAKNVDTGRLKLFFLSVLWRASISSNSFFEDVSLGDVHEKGIRKMILDNDPGDINTYPILLMRYSINHEDSRKFISKIFRKKMNGNTWYVSLVAGLLVVWFVSPNSYPLPFKSNLVSVENELNILNSVTRDFEFIKNFIGEKNLYL